jgi:hypothetical protein
MTSPALAIRDGGTARPNLFAVLRLTSNFIGACSREQLQVVSAGGPVAVRIVWLFSFVLGYSRLIWARFVQRQDMQTLPRGSICSDRGVPRAILYDRKKTTAIADTAGNSSRSHGKVCGLHAI